ncbi:uncharacterized protein LOC115651237 [Gopherus evgoodei]|uniref:uncharacterized protein LOC115651237 n=1 Tax=Gopherus evgoodei TaxID=1825980 RepID=UPI0011CFC631|nr:uncharacterized protein LOC115651237 [Gopherus evgoodei]
MEHDNSKDDSGDTSEEMPRALGPSRFRNPLSISWLLPPTLLAGHCAAPFPAHLGAGDRGREHLPSSFILAKTPSAKQEWTEEEEEEEKEEEDVSPEQDTIRVIQEHLWGRAEVQKSFSCAGPESALPLLPSPPTQGVLSQRIPHPQWGELLPCYLAPQVGACLMHTKVSAPRRHCPSYNPSLCRATLVSRSGVAFLVQLHGVPEPRSWCSCWPNSSASSILSHVCASPQQQGLNTLEPHFSKAALVESIAELIENLPVVPEPTFIISSFMAAVCSLSKLKPLLALELESHLLRALLYTIFTIGTGQDATHFQALHNIYLQSLDAMVGCLLTKTPTPDMLQHVLEMSRMGWSGAEFPLNPVRRLQRRD